MIYKKYLKNINIKMEVEKNISLRNLAVRVIKGEFGNEKEREIKLG